MLRLKLGPDAPDAEDAAREILRKLYGEDGSFSVAAVRDLLPGIVGRMR